AGALRQRLAKFIVPFIADPNPIEGTQDNRLLVCQENNAAGTERIDNLPGPHDQSVTQLRADWRRHIDLESGDLERLLCRRDAGNQEQKECGQQWKTASHRFAHFSNCARRPASRISAMAAINRSNLRSRSSTVSFKFSRRKVRSMSFL